MAGTTAAGRKSGLFTHLRTDNWWLEPLLVFIVFGSFLGYSMWAGLQGEYYWAGISVNAGDYLCPLYSPLIFIDGSAAGAAPMEHAWFGAWPDWWPSLLPASPALWILAFPALFRFTCYYYRGAYYKAFVFTPPACAVGGVPRKGYFGEMKYMIFQNLHRYTLYFALIFIFILGYDAWLAMWQTDAAGNATFGMGVGTIIMIINPILIGSYTIGCHAFRHLVGGGKDVMSNKGGSSMTLSLWRTITWFNENHKKFAWASLLWVGFTDIYVRMVSSGIITDLNTWN